MFRRVLFVYLVCYLALGHSSGVRSVQASDEAMKVVMLNTVVTAQEEFCGVPVVLTWPDE